jgi:hypothetical protein
MHASKEQLSNWKVAGGGYGIHWPDLDEDTRSPAFNAKMPIPCLYEYGLIGLHHRLSSTALNPRFMASPTGSSQNWADKFSIQMDMTGR